MKAKKYNTIDKSGNLISSNIWANEIRPLSPFDSNLVKFSLFEENRNNVKDVYIFDLKKGKSLFNSSIDPFKMRGTYLDNGGGALCYVIETRDGKSHILYVDHNGYKLCLKDLYSHIYLNSEMVTLYEDFDLGMYTNVQYIKLNEGDIIKQTDVFDFGELFQPDIYKFTKVGKVIDEKIRFNVLNEDLELVWKEDEWFRDVGNFHNELAIVKNEEGKRNWIDINGELRSPYYWFDYINGPDGYGIYTIKSKSDGQTFTFYADENGDIHENYKDAIL